MQPLKNPSSPVSRDWRLAVTLSLLVVAIVASAVLSHGAPVMLPRKLADFPRAIGNWQGGTDDVFDARTLEILSATDTLSRPYANPLTHNAVGLFIGFFASQRKGGAIHSPKNCLPGSGWDAVSGTIVPITIPRLGETVEVNKYVVQNGLKKQIVLYWYQSQGRIIASEYTAKICLIWDAVRRNRTDGALVRVVVPVSKDEETAFQTAQAFVQDSFPELVSSLPN
jgi:EpsI family protein